MLVEVYEKQHFPIEAPDPIEFLNYVLETRGLARKDLEPYIGPRGRVSDIMNRVRPLSLDMIRRLSTGLGLPANVLIQDYSLRQEAA
jgi:HTH-type transcriptional regulator/antitoxin HigA